MDVEDPHRMGKLPRSQITKIIRAFCNVMEKAGYYVGVYANKYWWTTMINMDEVADLDRWVAHYGVKTPGVAGDIWQYTETGKLYGYSGELDLNFSEKNYPAIIQKAGLNGFPKPGNSGKIKMEGMLTGDEKDLEVARRILSIMGFEVVWM
jgi:lysozyme